MSEGWAATLFDGRSAAGGIVLLRIDGESLLIMSREALERVPLVQVAVAEAFERSPRMLNLPEGRTLEVKDPERTLPRALEAAGKTTSWVVQMQQAWPAVVAALALLLGGAVWTYLEGVPVAARYAAHALPPQLERRMGENVLALLDARMLRPSKLPVEHRERIVQRFRAAAAAVAPNVDVRVEFRSGPVNAFALPGGIIVVFDELVAVAGNDDRVLGVLGHELGHVVHRHSTRQLLQALGVGALTGLVWGDFSSVAANVPLVLGVMRYGRAFEIEADDYSMTFLRANQLSPRPLYEFLQRVQGDRRDVGGIPDFLSSHPDVNTRIERLKREVEAYDSGSEVR